MISIKGYGKINLTLEVGKKMDDGYHQLESIFQSVSIYDTISVERRADGRINISGNSNEIPYDFHNIVYKVAERFLEYFNISDGLDINIEKNIPVSAGLAGGSTDGGALMKALNLMYKKELNEFQMSAIVEDLGSDIPFTIYGGRAYVSGRGEIIKPLNCYDECSFILVNPGFEVSTREIYEGFDEIGKISNNKMTRRMISKSGSFFPYIINNLQDVTTGFYPEVLEVIEKISEIGGTPLMSGSGPSVIAFGSSDVLELIYDYFLQKYNRVYKLEFVY